MAMVYTWHIFSIEKGYVALCTHSEKWVRVGMTTLLCDNGWKCSCFKLLEFRIPYYWKKKIDRSVPHRAIIHLLFTEPFSQYEVHNCTEKVVQNLLCNLSHTLCFGSVYIKLVNVEENSNILCPFSDIHCSIELLSWSKVSVILLLRTAVNSCFPRIKVCLKKFLNLCQHNHSTVRFSGGPRG